MTWIQAEILSLSILIAAVIGVFKIKSAENKYFPFILLVWVASVNEILCGFLMKSGYSTNLNNNIYVLSESLMILWFFKRFRTVFKGSAIFIIVSGSYLLLWIIENFIIRNINLDISYYFRIYYSFLTVIYSITTVNYLIVTERKSLLKLPVFLICMGFIIYFTNKILVETFELYGLNRSFESLSKSLQKLMVNVYIIIIYLNSLVNLIYALAVLWIPKKQRYTLFS